MKQKVCVVVKTYPTLSKKYDELVCTAGFTEDGKFIRIYPVPFRKLEEYQKYSKFQEIEYDLIKNESDFRPESYRPRDYTDINIIPEIKTKKGTVNWEKRKDLVLKNVEYDMNKLILSAKDKSICNSLAVFKPTKIRKFYWKNTSRNWDPNKIEQLQNKQISLFDDMYIQLKPIRKLPYNFYYEFEDINGKVSNMMIIDWEIGSLYWNTYNNSGKNELEACEKVKQKYWDKFMKDRDIYFFLGTTQRKHYPSKNPFTIIGVFYPPKDNQLKLF